MKMDSPSMSYSFSGKRILVTGGAQGIGEEIVRKFYKDGATVFVLDKQKLLLDKLKKDLPKVQTICVDLLNWEATQAAVLAISPLDHLVNNAGIFIETPVLKAAEEQIDQVLGVNLKAVICVSQAFVNGNIKCNSTNGTTIVCISSSLDRFSIWSGAAYCASKAGVTSLTKTMALEFAELNVRVNCICPSYINTELSRSMDSETKEKIGKLLDRILLKDKELELSDVGNAVLFFSSPLSCMITGTSLLIDAGLDAH